MADSDTYKCLLTDAGAELTAKAYAEGLVVKLTKAAVGDGGGEVPNPTASATGLVNQVYEKEIDLLTQDDTNKNTFWASVVIPADVGGFYIREFGFYAEDPDGGDDIFFAYGSHSNYFKPLPSQGQSVTHEIRAGIMISNDAELTINVGESSYATQSQVRQLSSIVEDLRKLQAGEPVTLSGAVAAGESIELPEGMSYIPGKNALIVSWNGLKCSPGTHYAEGEAGSDGRATTLSFMFDCLEGDEIDLVILGHSNADAVIVSEIGG